MASSASGNGNLNLAMSYISYPYYVPPTGKNKPLKKNICKYYKLDKKQQSGVALSARRLNAKRDEFWDTAPAFEGRVEIWNALHAAVDACHADNVELAQAILDSANIIVPNGLLNDCYDELGNRYQIPSYVLALAPSTTAAVAATTTNTNQRAKQQPNRQSNDETASIDEDSVSLSVKNAPVGILVKANKKKNKNNNNNNNNKQQADSAGAGRGSRLSSAKVKDSNNKQTDTLDYARNANTSSIVNGSSSNNNANTIEVKVRVSAIHNEQGDLMLSVSLEQSVASLKKKLSEMLGVPGSQLRLFFGGRHMRDRERLGAHRLYAHVVLQVIVREIEPPAQPATTTAAAAASGEEVESSCNTSANAIRAHLERYLRTIERPITEEEETPPHANASSSSTASAPAKPADVASVAVLVAQPTPTTMTTSPLPN